MRILHAHAKKMKKKLTTLDAAYILVFCFQANSQNNRDQSHSATFTRKPALRSGRFQDGRREVASKAWSWLTCCALCNSFQSVWKNEIYFVFLVVRVEPQTGGRIRLVFLFRLESHGVSDIAGCGPTGPLKSGTLFASCKYTESWQLIRMFRRVFMPLRAASCMLFPILKVFTHYLYVYDCPITIAGGR